MIEDDFEGSLVLEKLAEIGKVDEFFDAVDSDDLGRVRSLLRKAEVDLETIEQILRKIENGE